GLGGAQPVLVEQRFLAGYGVRADLRLWLVAPGPTVDDQVRRVPRRVAAGVEVDGAEAVGHRGDDLQAGPGARVPGQPEGVHAQVEYVLLVAGDQDGDAGVLEGVLAVAGQRGRLGRRVVAAEHDHAAVRAGAHGVGVLDRVPAAVQAGALAVPGANHTVQDLIAGDGAQLAAPDDGGGEFLVEPGAVHDPVRGQGVGHLLQGQVETAQ